MELQGVNNVTTSCVSLQPCVCSNPLMFLCWEVDFGNQSLRRQKPIHDPELTWGCCEENSPDGGVRSLNATCRDTLWQYQHPKSSALATQQSVQTVESPLQGSPSPPHPRMPFVSSGHAEALHENIFRLFSDQHPQQFEQCFVSMESLASCILGGQH